MEQVTQRCDGCPIPGDTQGQAAWGSEHLLYLQVTLFIAGELDKMAFKGPFQRPIVRIQPCLLTVSGVMVSERNGVGVLWTVAKEN